MIFTKTVRLKSEYKQRITVTNPLLILGFLNWKISKFVYSTYSKKNGYEELDYGFLKKLFLKSAPLSVDHFQSSLLAFGWVQQQTHPKVMTGNGQLAKVHIFMK